MSVDRREANRKVLSDAEATQLKTLEAIERIKAQTAQTEEVGAATLQQLREQGLQMEDLSNEFGEVDSKLDKTKVLQAKFDFWAGNWLGGKKAAAEREAASYIASQSDSKMLNVADVFEQQKFDSLSRKWRPHNFVLYSNPTTEVSVAFDPERAAVTKGSQWVIDHTLPNLDALGWTYSSDFKTLNANGSGVNAPLWNSYVRRRKWRHESKSSNATEIIKRYAVYTVVYHHRTEVVSSVEARNQERLQNNQAKEQRAKQAGGAIGSAELKDTGYTSTVIGSRGKQEPLDEESLNGLARLQQRDEVIDAGLEAVSSSLDTIFGMANAMKEESVAQTAKVETLRDNASRVAEKAVTITARQKHQLR